MKNLYREGIDVLGDATADTGMYTSALTELPSAKPVC